MTCPDCLGEGEVERERVVGGYSHGNPWQGYDVYWVECERCGGSGDCAESRVAADLIGYQNEH